MLRRDIRF